MNWLKFFWLYLLEAEVGESALPGPSHLCENCLEPSEMSVRVFADLPPTEGYIAALNRSPFAERH